MILNPVWLIVDTCSQPCLKVLNNSFSTCRLFIAKVKIETKQQQNKFVAELRKKVLFKELHKGGKLVLEGWSTLF